MPVDQIVTTGMQKQAQVLWAWIEISSPGSSRQELEQRRQAVRLLDVAASSTDISPRDLDSLMASLLGLGLGPYTLSCLFI